MLIISSKCKWYKENLFSLDKAFHLNNGTMIIP